MSLGRNVFEMRWYLSRVAFLGALAGLAYGFIDVGVPDMFHVCSRAEAHIQAALYYQAKNHTGHWTECPDPDPLIALQEVMPSGHKVVFDIGCNKGYTSKEMFELWAPGLGISGERMVDMYKELFPEDIEEEYRLCGNCNDCRGVVTPKVQPPEDQPSSIAIHCFEPSTAHLAMLKKTRSHYFGEAQQVAGAEWIIHHAVVGQEPGTATFQKDCRAEFCGLDNADPDRPLEYMEVVMEQVDDFCKKNNIMKIDILKIDTEGHDAAVLLGADSMLAAGKVGLIMFEHNNIGVWKTATLKQTIESLSKHGFLCYYMGRPTLTRLTHCWVDEYDEAEWSNVVCASMWHPVQPVLEQMSFIHKYREGHHRGSHLGDKSGSSNGNGQRRSLISH